MRLARRTEALHLDQLSQTRAGISAETLMEKAGEEIFSWIEREIPAFERARILILCGPGHNGGDGFAVARRLAERSETKVRILFAEGKSSSELWKKKKSKAIESGVLVEPLDVSGFADRLHGIDIVIDALFGVGLDRDLEEPFVSVIRKLNQKHLPVLSIDGPSGLDGDAGVARGAAVKAEWTLSCGVFKPGFFLNEGPRHCGKISLIDVGFPAQIVKEVASTVELFNRVNARKLWPKRSVKANKTHFGKLAVLGGAVGMEGAAVLTATAAARMGAGYVFMGTQEKLPWDQKPADFLSRTWSEALEMGVGEMKVVAIGPGLGQSAKAQELVKKIAESKVAAVADADAIACCQKLGLFPLPANWIFTPHAGELSRVVGISALEIEKDRLAAARKAQLKMGGVVLLKGFRTVVDDGSKSSIIYSGNPALAKAGTGDVLTGFIGALLAQGLAPLEAASLGGYVHGALADFWVRSGHPLTSLMASDLPELLREFSIL